MPKIGVKEGLIQAMETLKVALQKELTLQGHSLTGSLRDSIGYEIKEVAFGYKATMSALDYGVFMEFGVEASRIPYTAKDGSQGKSKYIQGLIRFWELRGLPQREAVSAAFATAKVHQREGMPTRASYRFSETGERTGFVKSVIEANLEKIASVIEWRKGAEIQTQLAGILKIEPLVIST